MNSEVSGVGFSRHPLSPLTKDNVLVEAVYGLGEGLVSGELEADRYEVYYVYMQQCYMYKLFDLCMCAQIHNLKLFEVSKFHE